LSPHPRVLLSFPTRRSSDPSSARGTPRPVAASVTRISAHAPAGPASAGPGAGLASRPLDGFLPQRARSAPPARGRAHGPVVAGRSEEHTSELQSLTNPARPL